MTMEGARGFLTQVKKDVKLSKMISSANDDALRLALAQGAGYNFTLEELEAARDELDDADLDAVAGGLMDGGGEQPREAFPYEGGFGIGQGGWCVAIADGHQKDSGGD